MDFDLMTKMIHADRPFKYARYGDGEWNCILGRLGSNCDGHFYSRDLGERLKTILESKPDYYLGLQNVARDENSGDPEFLRLFHMNQWVDNEILHRASINDYLSLFFKALSGRLVTLVGPHSLIPIATANDWGFVQIPVSNCWKGYCNVKTTLQNIDENIFGRQVFLLCASMMSEVLIDDMKHTNHTLIDCGSLFMPYVGINSRTYHKKIIERNGAHKN